MYDIIGDIHGHAAELIELLEKMGYREVSGVFRHPSRKVIFCGDFIDRGPSIPDVVRIARGMVEGDAALAVAGNHEFNALAFHTERSPGLYFRPHDEKNLHQHGETMRQFDKEELRTALEWFAGLPAALDLGNLRVVHACWDPEGIELIQSALETHGGMTAGFLKSATDKHHQVFRAVERVMKGPEIALPDGITVKDKEGNPRRRVRIRWYDPPAQDSLADYSLPSQQSLQLVPVPPSAPAIPYPETAPPVFVGHYWLPDAVPRPLRHNVACLDYSVARHGMLCGYRFEGESVLKAEHFVTVRSRS